jgi:hypothetical protein
MLAPFDIYRAEANGSVTWLETVENFDNAVAHLQWIGASNPGMYFILSQVTGNRLSVEVNAGGELTTRTA